MKQASIKCRTENAKHAHCRHKLSLSNRSQNTGQGGRRKTNFEWFKCFGVELQVATFG